MNSTLLSCPASFLELSCLFKLFRFLTQLLKEQSRSQTFVMPQTSHLPKLMSPSFLEIPIYIQPREIESIKLSTCPVFSYDSVFLFHSQRSEKKNRAAPLNDHFLLIQTSHLPKNHVYL